MMLLRIVVVAFLCGGAAADFNQRYKDALKYCKDHGTCPMLAPIDTTILDRELETVFKTKMEAALPQSRGNLDPLSDKEKEAVKEFTRADFGLTKDELALKKAGKADYGKVYLLIVISARWWVEVVFCIAIVRRSRTNLGGAVSSSWSSSCTNKRVVSVLVSSEDDDQRRRCCTPRIEFENQIPGERTSSLRPRRCDAENEEYAQ